jgi:hypothetical protein
MKKILFIALGLGFLFFGVSAYLQSKPAPKNERIYQLIKPYSPYYLDKRFGGLQIMSKEDKEFKEKPNNMEVFHRLEALEKKWGKSHLVLQGESLNIKDNNNSVSKTIPLENQKELDFIHAFYGI